MSVTAPAIFVCRSRRTNHASPISSFQPLVNVAWMTKLLIAMAQRFSSLRHCSPGLELVFFQNARDEIWWNNPSFKWICEVKSPSAVPNLDGLHSSGSTSSPVLLSNQISSPLGSQRSSLFSFSPFTQVLLLSHCHQ